MIISMMWDYYVHCYKWSNSICLYLDISFFSIKQNYIGQSPSCHIWHITKWSRTESIYVCQMYWRWFGRDRFFDFIISQWDLVPYGACSALSHYLNQWWRHQTETFSHYWPFVRGIHRSPVNSPHKGQWCRALMFSLICVWINGWVNNREAGDLRRYRAHYDVIVMQCWFTVH